MSFRRGRAGLQTLIAACFLAAAPAAGAQVEISPQLVGVSDGVEAYLKRKEPGWTRQTLPPPGSGGNFIIDFYRLGDRYVKVVLSPGLSPEEAEYGLGDFTAHIRTQRHARQEGPWDEGYLWGNTPDQKGFTFRKGNLVVYMAAKLGGDARRFAREVAEALPDGDRVGLRECSPERRLAAPSPLLARWTEAAPEGGGFRVLLPCDAERGVEDGRGWFTRRIRTKRGYISYHVAYSALSAEEARRTRRLYAGDSAEPPRIRPRDLKVIGERRFTLGGFPALEYVAGAPGGGFWRTLLVASDTHSYTLTAFSSSEEKLRSAEVEEFFRSFDITDGARPR